eukprot:m.144266 g.144266  ORF g.144266 m.144266 type:complete len:163 (-) comp23023_c1_seq1:1387-1875(-)
MLASTATDDNLRPGYKTPSLPSLLSRPSLPSLGTHDRPPTPTRHVHIATQRQTSTISHNLQVKAGHATPTVRQKQIPGKPTSTRCRARPGSIACEVDASYNLIDYTSVCATGDVVLPQHAGVTALEGGGGVDRGGDGINDGAGGVVASSCVHDDDPLAWTSP